MDRAPLPATVEIDMGPEPTSQALDADTPEPIWIVWPDEN